MTYPPQLPTVLFSALNSIEGNPRRRPRRGLRTRTSHGRGHLHPRRRVLVSLVGAIALAVVLVLGVRLGDGEEGATGSLGLHLGSAAGSVLPFPPFTQPASAHARSSARLAGFPRAVADELKGAPAAAGAVRARQGDAEPGGSKNR